MKLIVDDPAAFNDRVGKLSVHEFHGLPIQPTISSVFYKIDLPKLHDFVRRHPAYHIVSGFEGARLYFNFFHEAAIGWFLADGDPDPEIIQVKSQQHLEKGYKLLAEYLKSTGYSR